MNNKKYSQLLDALKRISRMDNRQDIKTTAEKAIAAAENSLESQNKDSTLYLYPRDEVIAKLKKGLEEIKELEPTERLGIFRYKMPSRVDCGLVALRTLAEVKQLEEGE